MARKTTDTQTQGTVLQKALQLALASSLANARLHALYDGMPASVAKAPPMRLFRTDDPEACGPKDLDLPPVAVDQVRGIVKYNAFGYGEQTQGGFGGTGLWVVASFVNHAANPNTERTTLGEHMCVKAAKPIKRGEEIFINYVQGGQSATKEERQKKLQKWRIVEG